MMGSKLFTNRAPFFHGIDAFVLDLGGAEGHVFGPPPAIARSNYMLPA